MRKAWTDHVADTRKKGNRGKKTMSHREAMKAASESWGKVKKKLLRAQAKKQKSAAKPPPKKLKDEPTENGEA